MPSSAPATPDARPPERPTPARVAEGPHELHHRVVPHRPRRPRGAGRAGRASTGSVSADQALDWAFLPAPWASRARSARSQTLPGELGRRGGRPRPRRRRRWPARPSCARAAAALARTVRRQTVVATTLLDGLSPDRRQGRPAPRPLAEGIGARRLPASTPTSREPDPCRIERVVRGRHRRQGGAGRARPGPAHRRGRRASPATWSTSRAAPHARRSSPSGPRRWPPRPASTSRSWTPRRITKARLGGLLGVNRGSVEPPRLDRAAPTSPRGGPRARWRSSARASPSTPAACRSRRPTA